MTTTLAQIAEQLAVNSKASGFDCFGDLWDRDDHGHLTDAEWEQVCNMAEGMKSSVIVPALVRQIWDDAACAVYAEEQAERRYFGH